LTAGCAAAAPPRLTRIKRLKTAAQNELRIAWGNEDR
jgi:hypothetical protein